MPDLSQTSSTSATIVLHMYKKFEVNWTKIMGGCQSYTKAAPRESGTNLTLLSIILILDLHATLQFAQRLVKNRKFF